MDDGAVGVKLGGGVAGIIGEFFDQVKAKDSRFRPASNFVPRCGTTMDEMVNRGLWR
jgi:hypothetical protein